MEYRTLGRSGLMISKLSMGTMSFGGRGSYGRVGDTNVKDARRQVDMCLDIGINLIDTADAYSEGQSEEIVGEVMRNRRDRALIATKVRFATGPGPNDLGLTRHHILAACDASLRRLGTDHIDLYQFHEWDGFVAVEEMLEALDILVRSGKVRSVGVSNFTAWQLMKALGVSTLNHLPRFTSMQIYYSLQAREVEYELIPIAVDQGLGVLVWSPLAAGLLSGRYRRDSAPKSDSRQLTDWGEPPVYDREKLYNTIDVLVAIADGRGVSAAQVALAWVLARPAVTSVIVGARTTEQLADNLGAAEVILTPEERRRLDEVSAIPLLYPYWHQAKNAGARLGPVDQLLLRPAVQG